VIIDLDVGQSDPLLDDRMLTHVRNVEVSLRGDCEGDKGENDGSEARGDAFHIL
jgi:hypothetical protein